MIRWRRKGWWAARHTNKSLIHFRFILPGSPGRPGNPGSPKNPGSPVSPESPGPWLILVMIIRVLIFGELKLENL